MTLTLLRQTTAPKARRQVPSQRRRTSSSQFRTDIEGLRAIGVLLVVVFHASIPFVAGGFVGVDVFFVISGFLITGLLLREWSSAGRISLQDFYARRVRRILPAACVVLSATAALAPFFFDPLRTYRAIIDMGAALLYVANWRFIHQNNNYLAASNHHSPALHFWSLSVEEQFYLFWPLLIVLITAFMARRTASVRKLALGLGIVLACVVAGSLVLSIRETMTNPNLAYLATTTRAWQFGMGGLLAVALWASPTFFSSSSKSVRAALHISGWVGFLALLVAAIGFTSRTTYPGWPALVPTLGAVAIIASGSSEADSVAGVGRWLSLRPLRWVGRVSYSWYLWHWPVIVFALAKWPDLGLAARCGLMVFALGLAWGTHVLVERPLVTWRWIRSRARSSAVALTATAMAAAALSAVGVHTHMGLVGQSTSVGSNLPSFKQVFGTSSIGNSGNVQPSPLQAPRDQPSPKGCLVGGVTKSPANCVFGPKGGTPVVLYGDSHAQQWQEPLINIADTHGWRLYVFTYGGCPTAQFTPAHTDADLSTCSKWKKVQLERIAELRPRAIVTSSLNSYGKSLADTVQAWNITFSALAKTGANVIFLRDTPRLGEDVPSCISAHQDDWAKCRLFQGSSQTKEFVSWENEATDRPDVTRISMERYLCADQSCPAVRNGILLYRDESHVSNTAALILQPALSKLIVPLVSAKG